MASKCDMVHDRMYPREAEDLINFEEDLLTLHEDVMDDNDEGVDEILKDYGGDNRVTFR